jgi:hypothetical protein
MTLTGEHDSKHSYLTDDLDWWSMTASILTSQMTLTGEHGSKLSYLTDDLDW